MRTKEEDRNRSGGRIVGEASAKRGEAKVRRRSGRGLRERRWLEAGTMPFVWVKQKEKGAGAVPVEKKEKGF